MFCNIGGLLVDMGVLILNPNDIVRGCMNYTGKDVDNPLPTFEPHDPVIIEWRALTVACLDLVSIDIRDKLNLTQKTLPLAKVLEMGTWKVFV